MSHDNRLIKDSRVAPRGAFKSLVWLWGEKERKFPGKLLTMDLSSSHPYSDWTRLKRDYICFARISPFCLLINCFSRSPMLLSEPISKLFHIQLLLTDVELFVRTKWTFNTVVFNRDTTETLREILSKSIMSQLHLCRLWFSKFAFM